SSLRWLSASAIIAVASVALLAGPSSPWVDLVPCVLAAVWMSVPTRRGPKSLQPLVVIAITALLAHIDFGRFHGHGDYLDRGELYHTTLGSHYFSELGYDGLYAATLAVFRESETPRPLPSYIRNLRDNRIENQSVATERAAGVAARFEPERWQAFVEDVHAFDAHLPRESWDRLLTDHGPEATPFRMAMVRALTDTFGVGEHALAFYALLDPMLIVGMLALIAWAFGGPTALLFAVFLLANPLAPFGSSGGGMLRQLALSGAVLFATAWKRDRAAVAGFGLAVAVLDRVFPILLALWPLIALLHGVRRRFASDTAPLRFIVGFVVSLVALGAWSSMATGGVESWSRYAETKAKHESGFRADQISLRNLFSVDPSQRVEKTDDDAELSETFRFEDRRRDHDTAAARMRIPLLALRGFLLALIVSLLWRERSLRRALTLTALLPFVLLHPTSDDASFLALIVLGFARERRWAVAILGVAAVGWVLLAIGSTPVDLERLHWWISVLLAVLLGGVLVAELRHERVSHWIVAGIAVSVATALAIGAILLPIGSAPSPWVAEIDATSDHIVDMDQCRFRNERTTRWGPGWLHDDQLLVLPSGSPPDPTVSLEVPVRIDGEVCFRVDATTGPQSGIVRLELDGRSLSVDGDRAEIDLYSPTIGLRSVSTDPVPCPLGRQRLRFRVVGRNPASSDIQLGIDRVATVPLAHRGEPSRVAALRKALGWIVAHPADGFDGGWGRACEELVILSRARAVWASERRDAEEAEIVDTALRDRLRRLDAIPRLPAETPGLAGAAGLLAERGASGAGGIDRALSELAERKTPVSFAMGTRLARLGWSAERIGETHPAHAAREFRERRLHDALARPVDAATRDIIAAATRLLTDEIVALTEAGRLTVPAAGEFADRVFWTELSTRGLEWSRAAHDPVSLARFVIIARGLDLELPNKGTALDHLVHLQRTDGTFGALAPQRPDPEREAVFAITLAWLVTLPKE
ncbi:MAG: hypothetical protein KDC38_13585, partial [Planctomycetes bacterium]|nr:hypothetical protein [Planctomycetota bacterium]